MKKIPPGSEAANILVGEVDFLTHMITAFIRLKTSNTICDLTEVPVLTKFVFVLLGPTGNQSRYHEICRSIATLMTDEVCVWIFGCFAKSVSSQKVDNSCSSILRAIALLFIFSFFCL
ncbi:hypothetical protein DPMN_067725 [Dreissena polymorpha]|uniref:Band 3 cytoplasmic domain-containing protein n=1 Tax=Dreissena polymorpha TaxID=45954 RepID=A0A9D3YVS2_DREPO|nr:hypothetical protein DPMN_067725 [Dreissena polymorpha]